MNATLLHAAVVAVLIAAPATALAQSADKPALAAGDSWTYRQVADGKETFWTRRVVGVAADGVADMQIGERAFKVDASLNIIDPKGPEYLREQYRFPMRVGAEWTSSNKALIQYVMDQHSRYKVVALEPLTVPAGTFDCYRVEGTSTIAYKASFNREIRETYWYCPKVGSFAKVARDTTTISRDTPSSRESVEVVLVKLQRKG
jgi:hypothetical protein